MSKNDSVVVAEHVGLGRSVAWSVVGCRFYRASYASTVLAVIMCLSVRPSIRLSQVGVVQTWLNLESH